MGRDHRDVSYSLGGLGQVAKAKGRDQEADSYFDCASTILARVLGLEHPDLADLKRHRKGESVTLVEPKLVHDKILNQKRAARPIHPNRFLALPTILRLMILVPGERKPPASWPSYEKTLLQRRYKAAHPKPPAAKPK